MPNPGRMAIGAVLTEPHGARYDLSRPLPGSGCNNEAELRALIAGLEFAYGQGARKVRIYTDSLWLVEQLGGLGQRGKPIRPTARLAQWLDIAAAALQNWEQLQWRWIPRHCNTEADALAREAFALPQSAQGDPNS